MIKPLSMTSFLRGTAVGSNDRPFDKHRGKGRQSRLKVYFYSLGTTRNQNLSFSREVSKKLIDNKVFLCLTDSCSFTPACEESMANNRLISVIDGQLIAQVFVIINCHQHRLTSITNINRSALQPLVFNWQILNREDFLLEVTEGYLLFWLGCNVLADHGKATIQATSQHGLTSITDINRSALLPSVVIRLIPVTSDVWSKRSLMYVTVYK